MAPTVLNEYSVVTEQIILSTHSPYQIMESLYKKSFNALTATLIVYALLVASHEGEFWPLSIYPMFSQGGNTWSRALVRDVSNVPDSLLWQTTSVDQLPGETLALAATGINQNDIANFLAKSTNWEETRITAMRKIFGNVAQQKKLMLMQVKGSLDKDRDVKVIYTPFLVLAPDTVLFNPSLTYEGGR